MDSDTLDMFKRPTVPQGDLLDTGKVPSNRIPTSDDAAAIVAPLRAQVQRTILVYVIAMQGATCDQVERGTGIKHQTASSALLSLEKAGLVYRNGERRPTSSKARTGGKQPTAFIYWPTAKGRTACPPIKPAP